MEIVKGGRDRDLRVDKQVQVITIPSMIAQHGVNERKKSEKSIFDESQGNPSAPVLDKWMVLSVRVIIDVYINYTPLKRD